MQSEIEKPEKTINESIKLTNELVEDGGSASGFTLSDVLESLKDYKLFIEYKKDGVIQIYNASSYAPSQADNEFWRIMGWDLNKETLEEQSPISQERMASFLTQNNK